MGMLNRNLISLQGADRTQESNALESVLKPEIGKRVRMMPHSDHFVDVERKDAIRQLDLDDSVLNL